MLYHVSKTAGLKILQPHVSTHKKPYVYAIENMVTGLLFGAKKDDFDFIITTNESGTPTIYECYPGALEKKYQGKDCSVYELSEEGFLRGMTSWNPELVCEHEVEVVNEIVVPDLYERLLEEEQVGNLVIKRYQFDNNYRELISKHVVDRLIRFQLNLHKCCEQDERFATYYKDIIEALISVTDGHLLQ